MTVVSNPLDITDKFLVEAISLTYHYVCSDLEPYIKTMGEIEGKRAFHSIPSIETITEHLPPHFAQELYFEVLGRYDFEMVGAENEIDFKRKLINKEYHRFSPDKQEVKYYLHKMQFSFMEDCGSHYALHNSPVTEVW
jgi:hypothetical protein